MGKIVNLAFSNAAKAEVPPANSEESTPLFGEAQINHMTETKIARQF